MWGRGPTFLPNRARPGLNPALIKVRIRFSVWLIVMHTFCSILGCDCHGPKKTTIQYRFILTVAFFAGTSTQPQALNIVWLQRRLIVVKIVEEGDRISHLEGNWQLLDTER